MSLVFDETACRAQENFVWKIDNLNNSNENNDEAFSRTTTTSNVNQKLCHRRSDSSRNWWENCVGQNGQDSRIKIFFYLLSALQSCAACQKRIYEDKAKCRCGDDFIEIRDKQTNKKMQKTQQLIHFVIVFIMHTNRIDNFFAVTQERCVKPSNG